jgi:hypothetical protein
MSSVCKDGQGCELKFALTKPQGIWYKTSRLECGMRRFFYDTEFMEEPGSIELISIGVVGENVSCVRKNADPSDDGIPLFYACNLSADLSQANDWVKNNVFPQLPLPKEDGSPVWMPKDEIREQLLWFLKPSKEDPVELWGYYSAYDHVLLCWLFGRMVDLPEGMPMLTMDVKQYAKMLGNLMLPSHTGEVHNALNDALWTRDAYLFLKNHERISRGLF